MVFLGYLLGILIILHLSKKQTLPRMEMITFLLFGAASAYIGAKLYLSLYYIILNFSAFKQNPGELISRIKGGGVFYGGLMMALLFSVVYLRRVRLNFWKVGDAVGPGAALGHAVGRIGCFLGGCCYGRPSGFFWAVKFPHLSQKVHPTQLYESGLNLLNFVFLLALFRKKKFNGQVFCVYIINYSLIRFFVEYFRGDPGRGYLFKGISPYASLSIPQAISLAGLFAASSVYIILRKKAEGAAQKSAQAA